jgi:transcription initiation factor IIF auxiliary subunit
MAFSVERQIIRNPEGKIKFWKPNENAREHFHIGVWIEGSEKDLDSIERVEYILHPSFRRNVRSSASRKNKFSITIWTWGMFMIDVEIHLKDGAKEKIQYYLDYELPVDNGNNYVEVDP